jgi:hypothetical protein
MTKPRAPKKSEAEMVLMQALPEGQPRQALIRAMSQAHRRKAVAHAIVATFDRILAKRLILLPTQPLVDLGQPFGTSGDSIADIFDGLRLDAHDRAIVSGFIASVEGWLAGGPDA